MTEIPGIDPTAAPSGTGCRECDTTGGWWVHLRRCAQCGHIGCCNDSLSKHAAAHAAATGHRFIRSFEPGENSGSGTSRPTTTTTDLRSRTRRADPRTKPRPARPGGSRRIGAACSVEPPTPPATSRASLEKPS
jgi:hypothetical protein